MVAMFTVAMTSLQTQAACTEAGDWAKQTYGRDFIVKE